MGYRLNRLDEPVFIAVSKPLLTEFGIHHRLESCGPAFPHAAPRLKAFISSVQITLRPWQKVMTTIDGAVTVHIILAGIFEWIVTQSGCPLFKSAS